MNAPLTEVIAAFRARLEPIYGSRLRKLVLYGSRARGEAKFDSDIDIMIVLTGPIDRWKEVERTGAATSEIDMQYGVDISRAFATEEDFLRSTYSFLQNVREEGVAV